VKRSASGLLCTASYILSLPSVILVSMGVVDIRSRCTRQKEEITRLVREIEELRQENDFLMVKYYSLLNPEKIDKHSENLKLLKENEIKYLKLPSSRGSE